MPAPTIPARPLAGDPRALGLPLPTRSISTITPEEPGNPSLLTSKDAQAKVEVQQTAGESREDEAERSEDAPNHHHGARPPAGAQGAAHWAWKEAESTEDTLLDPQTRSNTSHWLFAWPKLLPLPNSPSALTSRPTIF